ncbi:MAG: hypothetical protein B7Z02_00845 [Rhodobacterales bacterium 32-67-9]|nr:MAG: hypothetical protein B7Z02_00845 [Rhodobacterales bacterium 32-67-9]
MPDYARLLDPEIRAFIAKTDRLYDPDTATRPLAEQRRAYDRLCAAFRRPYPDAVTATDAPLGGVPCRHYHPDKARPGATILYFHGGGYVLGGLDSHDDICAELSALTGRALIAVDYRLAPEHLHPAERDDALAALDALLARGGDRVVLAGDSAGGTLAALAAAARPSPRIDGQVLIYPALGTEYSIGPAPLHAEAPMLTSADMAFYEGIRFGGGPGPDTAWPLRADRFTGLPPTVIFTAECDPLAGDGPAYAARITGAGGRAQSIEEPGLVHGYLRARHMSARAGASFAAIAAAIAALADAGEVAKRPDDGAR